MQKPTRGLKKRKRHIFYKSKKREREATHWGKPVGEQSRVGLPPHLRLLWRQVRKSEAELGGWELVQVSVGRGSPHDDENRRPVLGIN